MQARLDFYKSLTRDEARMFAVVLDNLTSAHMIELLNKIGKLEYELSLYKIMGEINAAYKNKIPYHRLLHGPEIELVRAIELLELSGDEADEYFVWGFKPHPWARGPLEWAKRSSLMGIKSELDDWLMKRDKYHMKVLHLEALEKGAKALHTIAVFRLDKLHKGHGGPTANGAWWEQWPLARHFDDGFQESQEQREK